MSHTHPASAVTVAIPFYAKSHPAWLEQAIDSILAQTLTPQVFYLVQDGPVSPELAALVDTYTTAHAQIQLLTLPRNYGLPTALNLSILMTTTTYYARMDADDIAHPERLAKQVAFLDAHPEIDILGTWVREFHHDPHTETGQLKRLPTDPAEVEAFFHYRNPLAHPSVMFRHAVFRRIGLYRANFRTDQDLELWGRALRYGVGLTNLPEVLLYHRSLGVETRRAEWQRILRQAHARYSYNTRSPRLNLLKIAAIAFRLTPPQVQRWGYKYLRG
ncbi:MAG: hypothetical protein CV045_11365 [Cyanobacteria bacterium M5B4]|nr:MAG: hypothetical protein CV045_11365 [Cyanobacteria bacterium M5B4]